MVKALWTSLLVALAIGVPGVSSAGTITLFDVDFSSPPHTLGAPPAVGLGPSTPSQVLFGAPLVQGDPADPALEFRLPSASSDLLETTQGIAFLLFGVDAGSQFSIAFDVNAVSFADPADRFSFDLLSELSQVSLQVDAGGDLTLMTITSSAPASSIDAGALSPGQSSRFQFDIDIATRQIDVFQDGALVLDAVTFVPGAGLGGFFFQFMSTSPDSSVLLDNILVTATAREPGPPPVPLPVPVPEPSALVLLVASGLLLRLRGSRRRA